MNRSTRTMRCSLLFLILVAASNATAQQIPEVRTGRRVLVDIDRLDAYACELPAPPSDDAQFVVTTRETLVSWCVEGTTVAAANAAPWRLAADGNMPSLLKHVCKPNAAPGLPVLCYAVVPAPVVEDLKTQGIHTIVVSTPRTDAAGIVIPSGTDSNGQFVPPPAPSSVSAFVMRPTCIADGRTFEVGDPLPAPPASANGNLYSNLGAYTVELRVATLQKAGWSVWLEREQFAAPSVSGGAWFLLAWCNPLQEARP